LLQTSKGNLVFQFLLVIFFAILVVVGLDYNERARLIPVTVGIVAFLMTATLFLADAIPAVGSRTSFIRAAGIALDSPGSRRTREKSESPDVESQAKGEARGFTPHTWRIFLWLIFLALLLRYVEYLISLPLFIFLMMVVEGRQRLVTSLLTAAGMGVFYFVLFRLLLQATF
jgi:hypothetical protein